MREGVPLFDMLMHADAAPVIAHDSLAFRTAENDSRARSDGWLAACGSIGIVGEGELDRHRIIPVRESDAITGARLDVDGVAE